MKTGIIILNYNDIANTQKFLNQIKDYQCLSKIIVVDNCSTDNSCEILEKYSSSKIEIIKANKNKGYASGNNLGLKYLQDNTNCELAIISNPDVFVTESVLEKLIDDFQTNPDIAFLGPKILELGYIIKGWKCPTFKSDLISNIPLLNRLTKKILSYNNSYYQSQLTKVDVLHGCFFLGRINAFKKINNFDPHTFLYYEENILAKKASAKNLQSYIDTTVAVEHLLSKSVDKSLNRVKKYKRLKESQFYYEKTYNNLKGIKMFFLKLTYYLSLGYAYLTFWL